MAGGGEKKIRTVAFVSLGCPKNLVDSERMLGLLAEDGLAITADHAAADAIVINTCGFLEASKEESLGEIRRAVSMKSEGKCQRVVVAGCLVQRHKTKLLSEVPEIDRLVGVFDREHIVEAVRGQENPRQEHGHFLGKYHDLSKELAENAKLTAPVKETKTTRLPVFEDDRARFRLTPRHYAYLRISEGCNQGCSFCTIPSIRGLMRSKPVEQIMAEAKELAADGAVELNLIGQDTTSFGTDIGYGAGLSGLLKTLDRKLDGDVRWVRLMYAYPSCFTDEMIRTIGESSRIVKYIDMPLQHINDEMLTRMKRRVTRKQIEVLLEKLRKWVPGIAIRTTFIAGAPGETEQQHGELVRFVREFGFEMMGVFAYSQEPGTPMGKMEGQLPDSVKKSRVEELMLAQQEVAFAKAKGMKGKKIEVLVDRPADRDEDKWVARAAFQAPEIDSVTVVNAERLYPGQILEVSVCGSQQYDLVAELPKRTARSLRVVTGKC
ncbi:MAG TPA: 30S ribosomal protein S12 methylthiotransferase RimO [Tepidisphaeraceae bacterium]|nr:30S ribosomal protein S12 methylthiotransferase RimO [Tepidisphaeraceae bacterium]